MTLAPRDNINEQGGYRPLTGGPPAYHPRRSDWPPIPKPLVPCSRCQQHAAIFGLDSDGTYYCGVCIGRVDIFHQNMVHPRSALQMRADQALKATGEHDLLGTYAPLTFEGDVA